MQKIKWPIIWVTAFAIFFNLTPYLGFSPDVIVGLFILSPFTVIWLAYKILKDGTPSHRTFNEYFYDNHPYKRMQTGTDD